MNKIAVVIIVALALIGGGYWYLSKVNSKPNEQGYIPATNINESGGDAANTATVPGGSSQGSGVINSGSKLTPPAFPN